MRLPRHSTVAAYGALFVALGGTSYAVTKPEPNSVGSREIKNGSVRTTDLAKTARPMSKARVAQVVETTMTSTEVLSALSTAVEGEAGPQGAAGVQGATGAAGPVGGQGPEGDRGQALAYGSVGVGGEMVNAEAVSAPGFNFYCVKALNGDPKNITITIAGSGATATQGYARPATAPCDGYDFDVTIMQGASAVGHPFYFALN